MMDIYILTEFKPFRLLTNVELHRTMVKAFCLAERFTKSRNKYTIVKMELQIVPAIFCIQEVILEKRIDKGHKFKAK